MLARLQRLRFQWAICFCSRWLALLSKKSEVFADIFEYSKTRVDDFEIANKDDESPHVQSVFR